MKKILITMFLSFLFVGMFAQTLSKPELLKPANKDTLVMPEQNFQWKAIASLSPIVYTFEVANNPNWENSVVSQVTAPEKKVYGLIYGETYYWRVKASANGSDSDWSDVFNFKVLSRARVKTPTAGDHKETLNTDILIYNYYGKKISGKWTVELSGFDGFEYYLSENPNFDESPTTHHYIIPREDAVMVFNQDSQQYEEYKLGTYNKLKFNTTYYLKVLLYSELDNGDKLFSKPAIVEFTMAKMPTLSYPKIDAVYDMASKFEWKAITGADEYVIEVSEQSDFSGSKITQYVNTNSTFVKGLGFGKTYYWRVKAIATNESLYSEVRKFTTKGQIPVVVSPENNAVQNSNPVYFIFNRIEGADRYALDLYDASDKNTIIDRTFVENDTTYASTTLTVTKYLEFERKIAWTVKAFLNGDSTVKSEYRNIEVLFSSPTLVFPANNMSVNSLVNVKWSALLGATGYQIQYASDYGFTKDVSLITINSQAKTNVEVLFPSGRDFFIRMRALAGDKYSDYCEIRKFHTDVSQPQIIAPMHSYEGNPMIVHSPVSFIWSPVYGISSYVLQYSRDVNFENPSEIVTLPSTDIYDGYTKPINIPLGTYYWRIKGQSVWPLTNNVGKPVLDVNGKQKDSLYSSIYSNVGNFKVFEELGVNDREEVSFSIYPNPCNDKITVESLEFDGNGTLYITDVTGKRIAVVSLRDAYVDGKVEVDVSALNAGVYFMMIEGNKQILSRKFVKK